MKTDILLDNLLYNIREKTPPGTNMAAMLSDILSIGKEAIYRRLRGEVPFTFYEVSVIAEKLHISIDSVVGVSIPDHVLLHLTRMRFESPNETDFKLYRKSIQFLETADLDPLSEFGNCSNFLPMSFMLNYPNLTRFRAFKWMYRYETIDRIKPLSEVEYSDEAQEISRLTVEGMHKINRSFYILDSMMFDYLIKDIQYFAGINMISQEELDTLKQELQLLINEMEEIASNGVYPTGKKVQLYISPINLEASYSYIETQNTTLALVKIFSMNSITSLDKRMFDKIKNWVNSLKRLSILISESGEMQRVRFFQNQRETVDKLEFPDFRPPRHVNGESRSVAG